MPPSAPIPGDRLSGLDNKSVTGDVHRYSRFVRFIKIILPLGVIGIVGVLFIYPQVAHIDVAPLSQDDLRALKRAETENSLKNPVYNTIDSSGTPFSVTADLAKQSRENSDLIFLTHPSANLREDNGAFYMEAETGEYNQVDKILILNGNVVLKDDNNSVLETNDLTSSIEDGKAYSNSPATLKTDKGVIEGQSVIIDHQNQTTIFKGPAKAVILNQTSDIK